jgi:hypothetical protein
MCQIKNNQSLMKDRFVNTKPIGGGLVMKRLLTLSLILGFIFPAVRSEATGWSYKQTTNQAFYFIPTSSLSIDGEAVDADDVIGAFSSSNVCVGWADLSQVDANGIVTIPAMGQTGVDAYADQYMAVGEVPTFRIFDATYGDESTPTTQQGVMPLSLDNAFWFVPSDQDQNPVSGAFNNLESFQLGGTASLTHSLLCGDQTDSEICNAVDGPYTFFYAASGDSYVETGSSTTALGGCLLFDCAGVCPDADDYEQAYSDQTYGLCCTDSQT